MVDRRQAWQAIIAFGQHTQSNNVGRGMTSPPLDSTQWNDVELDMPSPPLDSTHGRTMSGVACHHRRKAEQMVKRRQAWQDITTLGQHTRSLTLGMA